jgi:hypothetical protein
MSTHVFLGPTVPLTQAKQILPTAYFHPPAECGDVLRILSYHPKPQIILIIDGSFHRSTPAIWHKEILLALEQGCHVIGASDMGALRAVELNHFGMEGIGHIFQQFVTGELEGDDEVAILYAFEDSKYHAVSEALVNIRATVEKAVKENLISRDAGNIIINTGKTIFYPQRTLSAICAQAKTKLGNVVEQFSLWAKQHYVDQKYLDGIAALKYAANFEKNAITTQSKKKSVPTERSIFIRRLQRHTNTTLRQIQADCETSFDKALQQFAKIHPYDFVVLQETAFALTCVYDIAVKNILGHSQSNPSIKNPLANYTTDNTLATIYDFLNKQLAQHPTFATELVKYQQWTRWLHKFDQCSHPATHLLIEQYSHIWLAATIMLKNRQIEIDTDKIQEQIPKLLEQLQLTDMNNIQALFANFSDQDFHEMMIAYAYFEIIKNGNCDFLNTEKNLESINWLVKYYQLIYEPSF